MREFCDWADTIPLMAGTVFSEMQGTLTRGDGRKNEWTQKEIDDHLTAAFGDKKDEVVAEFKQAFPRKKVQDVLYYAGASRRGAKNVLARKLEKGQTPVYNYLFAWEYPINGGITAFHCSELAFCFHALNVPQIKTATGGGPVAMALQDKVSQAWVNFARTGNPSQPGLEWRPYTPDNPQAMVFDTVSQCARCTMTSWCRCCPRLAVAEAVAAGVAPHRRGLAVYKAPAWPRSRGYSVRRFGFGRQPVQSCPALEFLGRRIDGGHRGGTRANIGLNTEGGKDRASTTAFRSAPGVGLLEAASTEATKTESVQHSPVLAVRAFDSHLRNLPGSAPIRKSARGIGASNYVAGMTLRLKKALGRHIGSD